MFQKVIFPEWLTCQEATSRLIRLFENVFEVEKHHPQILVRDFELYVEAEADLSIPLPSGFTFSGPEPLVEIGWNEKGEREDSIG